MDDLLHAGGVMGLEQLQFGHDSSPWMTSTKFTSRQPVRVLQFGHDSSPWMTMPLEVRGSPDDPLQFGHDSSPWMTTAEGERYLARLHASIRPRLIAVDDSLTRRLIQSKR